jgi:predicted ArsR family transcriptional regulator
VTDLESSRARALASPARRLILTLLADGPGTATIADLTSKLGLNHNAVRKHLAQLVAAGLVEETREARTIRGRPKLLYGLAPGTPARAERSYRSLATMLATVLATGEDPVEVGRRAATSDASPQGIEGLVARLAADGLAPRVQKRGARVEIVLDTCPYVDAAEANPAVVCALHLGLTQAAGEAAGVIVEGLTPRAPRRAGCLVGVTEPC